MKSDKEFEELVKSLHASFDWEKVKTVMEAINQVWTGKDAFGGCYVYNPTMADVKNLAYKLLKEAYNDSTTVSENGFVAKWYCNDLILYYVAATTIVRIKE